MRRLAAAAVVLTLTGTLTACGGDDDPETTPSPGAATTGTTASSGSAGPTDAPTSSTAIPSTGTPTSATPAPSAATGPLLDLPHVSVNAPAGYEVQSGGIRFVVSAQDPASNGFVALSDLPDFGQQDDLTVLAQAAITGAGYQRPPRILDPVEVHGVQMFHYRGADTPVTVVEGFGGLYAGRVVALSLTYDSDLTTPAQREEILASVMASLVLT